MRRRNLIVGTRGSKLARAQAGIIAARITDRFPGVQVTVSVVVTSGDRDLRSSLGTIGGKGVFIRELEQALLDGSIDLAVHSFKDVTARFAPGLALGAFLRPESSADVLVTRDNVPFDALSRGARIATGSVRRRVQLRRLRADLAFIDIRGNVDTRIGRVRSGECDAVVLSEAGLIRLGLEGHIAHRFDPASFFPAPGQGVITVELREGDTELGELCAGISDREQLPVSLAELSLLETVGFDCRTPLGVHTVVNGSAMTMSGFKVDAEGRYHACSAEGVVVDPQALGRKMGVLFTKGGSLT